MDVTVDSTGRVLIPKKLRDALGLTAGSKVDISEYGIGLALVPESRTGQVVKDARGRSVLTGTTVITDEIIFDLRDAGRK